MMIFNFLNLRTILLAGFDATKNVAIQRKPTDCRKVYDDLRFRNSLHIWKQIYRLRPFDALLDLLLV